MDGSAYHLSNIRDVTPLIEARVTPETIDRAYREAENQGWLDDDGNLDEMRESRIQLAAILRAAHGIDT